MTMDTSSASFCVHVDTPPARVNSEIYGFKKTIFTISEGHLTLRPKEEMPVSSSHVDGYGA